MKSSQHPSMLMLAPSLWLRLLMMSAYNCQTCRLALSCLRYLFKAKHIVGKSNTLADALSRSKFQVACQLQPSMNANQEHIRPHQLPWNWKDQLAWFCNLPCPKRTYTRAIALYKEFVHKNNKSEKLFPTPLRTLITFIMSFYQQNMSPATIATYVTVLSYVNKILGAQDLTSSFIIKKFMAGLQRQDQAPAVRLPITVEILHKLVHAVWMIIPSCCQKC